MYVVLVEYVDEILERDDRVRLAEVRLQHLAEWRVGELTTAVVVGVVAVELVERLVEVVIEERAVVVGQVESGPRVGAHVVDVDRVAAGGESRVVLANVDETQRRRCCCRCRWLLLISTVAAAAAAAVCIVAYAVENEYVVLKCGGGSRRRRLEHETGVEGSLARHRRTRRPLVAYRIEAVHLVGERQVARLPHNQGSRRRLRRRRRDGAVERGRGRYGLGGLVWRERGRREQRRGRERHGRRRRRRRLVGC